MQEAIEIYHKSVPALFIAMCFILVKRLAEKRRPALGDSSDIAWTLIMMSIGALAVYARQWTAAQLEATVAWVVLLALVLLVNRRRRLGFSAQVATCNPSTLFRIVEACTEVVIGLAAVVITTR